MKKYSLCNYEFIPDKKLTGQVIQRERNKMGITAAKLSEGYGLYLAERTVNSWEQGRTMPNIDFLMKLSEIFDVSLDELIVPNSKFYMENTDYGGELDIDMYNFIWYHIEKYIFSFLGLMEKKHFTLDFTEYLTFDGRALELDVLLDDYVNKCKEKYGSNYKTSINKQQREEIMYDLRRRIKVHNKDNELFYKELLSCDLKNKKSFDKLTDFDKTFLATAMSVVNYRGFFNLSALQIFQGQDVYILNFENHKRVDTYEAAVDYIYEVLMEHDYLWFKSNLKKL